ncbi:glycosyltransferase family 2 protein [Sphingomonas sp.]|uniref:glycosyltransferase family 2 protein n=1 Tax=Sphingomonas sp. TaxID=28214 RepID=UPI0035BC4748
MTKVTLLTASYNSARTIRDTVRSIEVQTHPDIEHIVIDGASKDDTLAIVGAGTRIAHVVSEPDKGIYDAYNKGLALASGEIVAFLNSDDFYAHPRVVEQMVRLFDGNPDLDAVHADLVYVDQYDVTKVTRFWKGRRMTPGLIRQGFHPAHPTLFLRRGVYERAGGFDLSYRMAADVEFMNRIFGRFHVRDAHVDDIWVIMREGGMTGGGIRSVLRQNREVKRGQRANDIRSPLLLFAAAKILDRSLQRLRARRVTLQPLSFDR